jgi:hypothetical protein
MYLQPLDEWWHATCEDPRPWVVISLVSLRLAQTEKTKEIYERRLSERWRRKVEFGIHLSPLTGLAEPSFSSCRCYSSSSGSPRLLFFIISSWKLHGIVRSDQLLADPQLSNLGVSDSKIWPGCNPLRILILGGSIPKIVEGMGKQISAGNLRCIGCIWRSQVGNIGLLQKSSGLHPWHIY